VKQTWLRQLMNRKQTTIRKRRQDTRFKPRVEPLEDRLAPAVWAVASGNWNSTSTWNGSAVPLATDDVIISGNFTVTENVTTAVAHTITLSSNGGTQPAGAGTLTFNSGAILTVGGTITFGNTGGTQSSTVTMTSGGTLISQGFVTQGTGTKTLTAGAGTVELSATNTLPSTFATYNNLTIDTGTTTKLGVNTAVNGTLTVNGTGTLDLNGFTLSVASVTGSGTVTDSGAAATFTVNNASGTDTFAGALTGTLALTKTGAGTLSLTGTSNTYSGATTITTGTLQVGANGALAASSDVSDNATLDLDGHNASIGALIGGAGGSVTSSVSGSPTLTIGGNGGTFSGVISNGGGTVSLIINNGGTPEVFAGTVANTYTGTTTVNSGELDLNKTSVVAVGGNLAVSGGTVKLLAGSQIATGSTLNVSSGTLALNGFNNTVGGVTLSGGTISGGGTLTSSSTFQVSSTSTSTISAILAGTSGSVGLTANGGTVILSAANTYIGTTTVSSGTLQLGINNALSSSSTVTVNGGTLEIATFNDTVSGVTLTSGSIDGSTGVLTSSSTFQVSSSSTSTISAILGGTSGSVGLTASGGTVILSKANTYTGTTTVSGGTLQLGASSALASSGSLNVNGGTFDLGGLSNTLSAVTLTNGTIQNGTLTSSSTYQVLNGSISAVLAGSVGLQMNNSSGTVVLSGANTYSGVTTITAGIIQLGASSSSSTGTPLGKTSVTVSSGGELDLNGNSLTSTASLPLTLNGTGVSSAGALTNSSPTASTYVGLLALGSASSIVASNGNIIISNAGTISGSFAMTLAGNSMGSSIASAINTASLTKSGNGEWTLTGANTYSGATTINAGTLQIGNASGGSLSATTSITDNGTLVLYTSGPFSNTITSGSTGSLVKEGPGTLTINGSWNYTGDTNVSAGTLQNGTGTLPTGTALSVAVNATFDLNGKNQSVAALAGGGTVTNSSPTAAQLAVNTAATNNVLWVDDSVPAGATQTADDPGPNWTWVPPGSPSPFSGTSASQGVATGNHQHYFFNATNTLSLSSTDTLVAYVYLDPVNTPTEIELQWNNGVGGGWNNRAYWGNTTTDFINYTPATYMGALPATGGWVRLAVPASTVGFSGSNTLNGMAFTVYGSSTYTTTWDYAGTGGDVFTGNLQGSQLSLLKQGAGNLTLTGSTNNYGGGTTISGGTLQVGNGGTTGSLGSGAVSDTASLVFDLSSGTVANNISGTGGTLTQAGSGTLILTGTNSYTGTTTISSGTLQVGNGGTAGSLGTGSVSNSSALVYNFSSSIAVSNTITGSGSVTITSTGGSISESGSNTISGGLLTTSSKTGTTLSNSNNVTSFNATNSTSGNISLTDAASSGLTITGISETGGTVSVTNTSGSITIAGAIAAGSNAVSLTSSTSTISESGSGTITGGTLTTSSSGGTTLTNSNNVTGFNATNSTSGAISLTDAAAAALTITGISQTGGGSVSVSNSGTGGSIVIGGAIAAGSSAVTLTSSSSTISESGSFTITGGLLTTSSSGGTTLGNSNSVTSFNATNSTSGAISLTNPVAGGLTITGISQSGGGSVSVTDASGSVNITGAVSASGSAVTLSGTTVTDSASAVVTGSSVSLTATSGGIGASGSPVYVNTSALSTTSSAGNGAQYLAASSSTTTAASAGALNAGSSTIHFVSGTFLLGAANAINTGSSISVEGATLDLNGKSQTVVATTLTGGIIQNTGAAAALTDSASAFAVQNGTISAVLAGSVGLTMNNASGTVTLSGANTYSGVTTITAGILKLGATGSGSNTPLGTTGVTVSSGGELDLNGFTLSAALPLTLNGTGVSSAGALTNTSATAATYGGLISLGSASSIVANNGNIILSNTGAITGSSFGLTLDGTSTGSSLAGSIQTGTGTLTKNGTGTWTLSGTSSNYSGATTINGGTLKDGIANAIPTGTSLTLNGTGTLDLNGFAQQLAGITAGATTATITNSGAAATLTVNVSSGSDTYQGLLAGTLNLLKTGAGSLTLSGTNTYTGTTTVSQGTLIAGTNAPNGAAGAFGNATTDIILGDASTSNAAVNLLTGGAFTIGRNITVSSNVTSGGYSVGGNVDTNSFLTGTITLNQPLTVTQVATSGSNALTLSGTINLNSNTLTLAGPGKIIISGSVTGGDLTLNSPSVLDLKGQTLTIGALNGNGTVLNSSVSTTGTLIIGSNNHSGTFSGVIENNSGSGGTVAITKSGIGIETLSGTNTYSGTTTINAGTLTASGGSAIGDSSAVVLANTAGVTFNITSNETIGSLAGGGTTGGNVTLNTNTLTVGGDGTSTSFGGVISSTSTTGGLTKTLGGTLTLTGTNTYTGVTTINGGVISVATIGNGGVAGNLGQAANTADRLVFGGGSLQYTGVTASTDRSFTLTSGSSSTIDVQSSTTTLTFSGGAAATTGALNVNKDSGNTGTLKFTSANSYSGRTTIYAGTLSVSNDNQLGTGSGVANIVIIGGTLLANTGFTLSSSRGIALGPSGSSGSGTIDVTASQTLTYGGIIADNGIGGNGSLATTTSGGTLILQGADTYSGTTTINAGTLQLGNAAALPNPNNINSYTDVTANGTLDLHGFNATIGALSGSGTVTSNVVTTAVTLTVGASNNSGTFSGKIQNNNGTGATSLSLIKTGTGSETLSPPEPTGNTYTGTTTIIGGVLIISADNNLGTAPGSATVNDLVINGGTLEATASFPLNANRGIGIGPTAPPATTGTFDVTSSNVLTYNGIIANNGGTGSLTKADTGTLVLGGANTYGAGGANQTTIINGTLSISSDNNLGAVPASATAANIVINGSSSTLQATATFAINPNRGIALGPTTGGGRGNIDVTTGNTLTYNGVMANNIGATVGRLLVNFISGDTGTLLVGGNNTYTGTTFISQGTVKLGATSSPLGTNVALGTTVNSGAALDLNGQVVTINQPLTLNGTGISGGGALTNTSATPATYPGLITLGSDSSIVASGSAVTISNTGTIIGVGSNNQNLTLVNTATSFMASIFGTSGSLTKAGTGIWVLQGVNTYGGATNILNGSLRLGVAGALPSGTTVTLGDGSSNTGGTLNLNSFAQTIAGLLTAGSGTNRVVDNFGGGALTINLAGSDNYAGILGGGASGNNLTLTKTGAGTLTLSGVNTFTGVTTISQGTLQIGNSLALQSSDVTDNATLDLNGISATIGALAGAGTVTSSASGTVTFTVGNTGSTATFAGVIQNGSATTLNLTKVGGGTEALTSNSNSYNGNTTISAGTLQIGAGGTTGKLGALGTVQDNSNFQISHSDDVTLTGLGITSISGTGTVTQAGPGKLIYPTGFTQSYLGQTSVTGGTLQVDGTLAPASGTSSVVVNGGVLQGVGTIGSATDSVSVTMTKGILAPGDGVPGLLTVYGNVSMPDLNSTLLVWVNSATQFSQLHVLGAGAFSSSCYIDVESTYTPTSTDHLQIITDATANMSGTAFFTSSHVAPFWLSYNYGTTPPYNVYLYASNALTTANPTAQDFIGSPTSGFITNTAFGTVVGTQNDAVAVGTLSGKFAVAVYNTAGGRLAYDATLVTGTARAAAVFGNKIYVAGNLSGGSIGVARYIYTGSATSGTLSLDPTFGSGGLATINFSGGSITYSAYANAIAISSTGTVGVVGYARDTSNQVSQFAVAELNSSGIVQFKTVNPLARPNGFTNGQGAQAYAAAFNGTELYVAGYAYSIVWNGSPAVRSFSGHQDFALAAYNASGLDQSFGDPTTKGFTIFDFVGLQDNVSNILGGGASARAIAIDTNDSVIVVGGYAKVSQLLQPDGVTYVTDVNGDTDFALAGYDYATKGWTYGSAVTFGTGTSSSITGLLVVPSYYIIGAGWMLNQNTSQFTYQIALAEFDLSGNFNPIDSQKGGFNQGQSLSPGQLTTAFQSSTGGILYGGAQAVIADPVNSLTHFWVSGGGTASSGVSSMAIAQYDPPVPDSTTMPAGSPGSVDLLSGFARLGIDNFQFLARTDAGPGRIAQPSRADSPVISNRAATSAVAPQFAAGQNSSTGLQATGAGGDSQVADVDDVASMPDLPPCGLMPALVGLNLSRVSDRLEPVKFGTAAVEQPAQLRDQVVRDRYFQEAAAGNSWNEALGKDDEGCYGITACALAEDWSDRDAFFGQWAEEE
jgi:autotransporter-associated beta strand protein